MGRRPIARLQSRWRTHELEGRQSNRAPGVRARVDGAAREAGRVGILLRVWPRGFDCDVDSVRLPVAFSPSPPGKSRSISMFSGKLPDVGPNLRSLRSVRSPGSVWGSVSSGIFRHSCRQVPTSRSGADARNRRQSATFMGLDRFGHPTFCRNLGPARYEWGSGRRRFGSRRPDWIDKIWKCVTRSRDP